MLGMSLISFLTLTVIAAVIAAVYQYGLRYRFLDGGDAFFGKLIVGWFGAWLASPVLGHWLWKIENVYDGAFYLNPPRLVLTTLPTLDFEQVDVVFRKGG